MSLTWIHYKFLLLIGIFLLCVVLWFKMLLGSSKYRLEHWGAWFAFWNRERSFARPAEYYDEAGVSYVRRHFLAIRLLLVLGIFVALIL